MSVTMDDGIKRWTALVIEDMKTGLTKPRSTVLTDVEQATVVAFRRP